MTDDTGTPSVIELTAYAGRLPRIPAAEELVPRLDGLRKALLERADNVKSRRHLERLPYCVRAAFAALDSLARFQVSLGAQVSIPRGRVLVLPPDARDPMTLMVDSCLDVFVRTQNAILRYISLAYSVGIGESMDRDFIKKIDTRREQLPAAVVDSIHRYWISHGSNVRKYRHKTQHVGVITSEGRVFVGADMVPRIYFALPNNPGADDAASLSYAPPVHAFPYLLDELVGILGMARGVVATMASDLNAPQARMVIDIDFKGGYALSSDGDGAPIPRPKDLWNEVAAALADDG